MTPKELELAVDRAGQGARAARTGLGLSMRLELAESLRSRWFHFYSVVVIGLMLLPAFPKAGCSASPAFRACW